MKKVAEVLFLLQKKKINKCDSPDKELYYNQNLNTISFKSKDYII